MRVSEAEQLVCPFMYNNDDGYGRNINCITTNCMAWKITEQFGRDMQGNKLFKYEPQDCEGYCQRLKS